MANASRHFGGFSKRRFGLRSLLVILAVAAGIAADCQIMMNPPGDMSGDPSGAPDPVPATPPTKLSELLLGGLPNGVALDLSRDRAYVAVDNRIRRLKLSTREWFPLQAPGGVFYGLDFRDDFLAQINPANGQITRIMSYPESSIIPPLNAGFVTGMDYNPDTGKLYVIDIFALGREATLFEFDPVTGVRTQIGNTGLGAALSFVFSLARDPSDGMLYTVDVNDDLWRINPNTAMAEMVGPLSANPTQFSDVQGLSFSPLDGKLYGLNPPGNGPVQIVTIDTVTGAGALVSELPLGYTGGSLAFKPDGTLWSIKLLGILDTVMFTDSLFQIDYTTNPATIPVDFPSLELSVTFGPQSLFQAINGLCFAPQGGGDQTILAPRDVDALGLTTNGSVLASAGDQVIGFDPDFAITPGGIDSNGLQTFLDIVVHPVTNKTYVRDGISGVVYEFVPGQIGITRQIQYRPAGNSFSPPRNPGAGIDPVTNRLFLAGDFQLHVVDLGTEVSTEIDTVNDDPQGVIVDHVRRRLHVNMLLGGPGGCSSIRTYDLDRLQVVGEICAGIQIFGMAFDPVKNRIATNSRFEVPTFDLKVFFFDMTSSVMEPYNLLLQTAADNSNAVDSFMAFNPVLNTFMIARPDTPPRVEFYQMPN